MVMQSSASINLVKKKVNVIDEILKWALSVGRLLVILTEIVAFSAFIYRFSLDRTIIDLHAKIKEEQAIISSISDREKQYRNLQERISDASKLGELGNRNVVFLNEIVKFTPGEISFNSFTLDSEKIAINASITSVSAMSAFINSLREHPRVSSVSIDSISNKSLDSSVNVIITARLR